MAEDRDLDVVVYGATGFVGRLTARVPRRARPGRRAHRAGRSQRVAARRGSRRRWARGAADWPLIVADSARRRRRWRAMAASHAASSRPRSGPTARYGLPLVEACAAAGHALRRPHRRGAVHARDDRPLRRDARGRAGARIVHTCGFDSIPSDLGVLLLHEAARPTAPASSRTRRWSCASLRGGVSGGTLASMHGAARRDRARDPALAPADRRPVRAQPGPRGRARPRRRARPRAASSTTTSSAAGSAPFVMAAINTRVVRRSNALQDWAYGRRFRYREVMGFGDRRLAPVKAGGGGRRRSARWARAGLRADARAARPRPAGPRRGAEREGAREGLLQDRHARPHDRRRRSWPHRRAGRPWLQGDRGDARRERAGAGARRRPAAAAGRRADAGDGDGRRARRAPARRGQTYEVAPPRTPARPRRPPAGARRAAAAPCAAASRSCSRSSASSPASISSSSAAWAAWARVSASRPSSVRSTTWRRRSAVSRRASSTPPVSNSLSISTQLLASTISVSQRSCWRAGARRSRKPSTSNCRRRMPSSSSELARCTAFERCRTSASVPGCCIAVKAYHRQ